MRALTAGETNMTRHREMLVVGITGILGFVLVGCVAPGGEGAARSGSTEVASETQSDASPRQETPVEEPQVAEEDCLKGVWIADNAFFLAGMREFGDEPQSVTGDVVVTYGEDGSMTTDYQDWLITFNVNGGVTLISRAGIDTGVFTASAHTVSIQDTQIGSKMLVTVNGADMPVDPNPVHYVDVPYICSATEASLTTSDGEMRMTRRES